MPFLDPAPVCLAEELAVLDLASGGRIKPVIVAGYGRNEFEMYGVNPTQRPRLVEELVEFLKQAWTGEPFEFRGHTIRVTPGPLQQPRPTLILGGASKAGVRRAARIGDQFQAAGPGLWHTYGDECAKLGLIRVSDGSPGRRSSMSPRIPSGRGTTLAAYIAPYGNSRLTTGDVIDVNVWGIIHGIRAFVSHLLAAREGHVINTISNSALTTLPNFGPYVGSKHAALAITETLQHDLRGVGSAVRVSAVLPGPIRSRMPTAHRRRPARYGAPAAHAPEVAERTQQLFGHPPDELVDRIWDDLHWDRFYVFTHEEDRAMAGARADAITGGQLAASGIALR